MSKKHARRVVLVTGASAGLAGRRREVDEAGGEGLDLQADVSDAAQVEKAAAEAERVLGPIDVWVNNAMVSVFSPVKETTPEEFRRVTEVTYLGAVHGTL